MKSNGGVMVEGARSRKKGRQRWSTGEEQEGTPCKNGINRVVPTGSIG